MQDELRDMLRKFDSKEKAWLEEREKLLEELQAVKSEKPAASIHDIQQELARSQAQVRAEALKAEAFQQSLVAAREALTRKAEQKVLAEAARQQALEEVAASLKKQEALEANLASAEQAAKEAKASQLKAIEAAATEQQSLEAALALAQQEADAELKRRGKVEKEASSRQEQLQSELAAALRERTTVAFKHAEAEAAAKAETDKAQLAVQEARKEAESARATAAAETAKAAAATEAAKVEAAKAEAAKVAVEKAKKEAEASKVEAEAEMARIIAQADKAEVARAEAEVEIAQIVANAGKDRTNGRKSLHLPEPFVEFDAMDESVASTMTPRSTSGRTDADKICTEETTDDKCEVESAAEVSDTQACDTEVATEHASCKDETDFDDEGLSAGDDTASQSVASDCSDGMTMLNVESDESATIIESDESPKVPARTGGTERTSTETLRGVWRSAMQIGHLKQPDHPAEICEPEAENSPVQRKRYQPAFETLMHLGTSLPCPPSVVLGSSDVEKSQVEFSMSSCSVGSPRALSVQREGKKSAGCKSHPFRHRKGGRGGNCIPKNAQKGMKSRAAHAFSRHCWPWFRMCTAVTLVTLCVFGLAGMLRGEPNSQKSVAEVELDHFSVLIKATFSVSENVEEARRAFNLEPEPRNALRLANLLVNIDHVSEALEVLLRAIEFVAHRSPKSIEDSVQIICALYNDAGTLLVRTGKVDDAVRQYQQALTHLDTAEEGRSLYMDYRYKVRLNLAAAEMMRSHWDSCSTEAQLASSESQTLSDRTSQFVAQSLLSGCLFQNDAPPEKTLHEARVALRLAPDDQLQLARENCLAVEEVAVRRIAGVREVKEVNMRFLPSFKFLMPDL